MRGLVTLTSNVFYKYLYVYINRLGFADIMYFMYSMNCVQGGDVRLLRGGAISADAEGRFSTK
jgi:hypothetical protein